MVWLNWRWNVWEKQKINHDLYFFPLWSMLLEHQVWMISIVGNFSEKLHHSPVLFFFSSSVSTAYLCYLLATTSTSLRFLFSFTSLQSFESSQALFLVDFYFRIIASYRQSSAFLYCSSVSEALFALSFSFLSERFFFVMLKAALAFSRNQ